MENCFVTVQPAVAAVFIRVVCESLLLMLGWRGKRYCVLCVVLHGLLLLLLVAKAKNLPQEEDYRHCNVLIAV